MPWLPELFSAPALEQLRERQQQEVVTVVPYFDGLLLGELDALVESFAGEPELHHPVRGRIRGEGPFRAFAAAESSALAQRKAAVRDVERVVEPQRGFEEVVLSFDTPGGRIELPHALVADHAPDGRLQELRIYFSNWALSGRHALRPPLLQRDGGVQAADVVGGYQRALADGDLDGVLAAFEAGGYAREPAGGEHVHRGRERLRAFYELLFSNGGGITLEHCAALDDGRCCALEYNVVRWGRTELPPQAGVAVYVRGENGGLQAARIYDDVEPPLG